MKGSHHIVLEAKRIRYEFDIKRNITVIQGDSATGKTTMIGLLSEYATRGTSTGIRLESDVDCEVYSGSSIRWREELSLVSGSIIFIDEGYGFIRSKEFADLVDGADNYYVLVTRESLGELPYSINEIYGIRTSGRFHYPQKIYNEFYPIYHDLLDKKDGDCNRLLIVEDSGSGYQFFSKVYGDSCISSHGNSGVMKTILSHSDKSLTVIADGAAFGAYIDEVVLYMMENPDMALYLPESFEWMVLKSGVVKNSDIKNILETPEEFIDSKRYISWERFFTDLLIESTRNDAIMAYNKNSLKGYYTEGYNKDLIINTLPDFK